jgi:PAS domain S-box-containing protein
LTEPSAEGPSPGRAPRGLHSTGLVVAVVGLVASVGAYWVASRETRNTEQERVQEVADQVADEIGDLLSDVEGLVSGVEGTLVATQRADRDEVERLLALQVDRSDLIISASLLRAREGSNLDEFGDAGTPRFLDFEVLSEQPDVLTALMANLAAIPDGEVELLDREAGPEGATAALATAFTTANPVEGEPPVSWVVELEMAFPADRLEEMTRSLAGAPAVAVYVDGEPSDQAQLLAPDGGLGASAAERRILLVEDDALVQISPTTEVLDTQERLIPLLVFLLGLTLTAVLTPLVGRLAKRREEVRLLSAQRDELDLALATSRQIEAELRASEQRFRSVLQSSPDVVLWIDPEHAAVQILNREGLFGHPAGQIGTIDDLLGLAHPDDLDMTQEGLTRLRATEAGTITEFECRLRRPDGEWEWLQVRGGRVQRDDGTSGSILAVLTTITDQKREEARRAQLEAQLVQSQRLEAVGQLAGGVAHDFNNILAAIVSGAELVLDEVDGQVLEDVEEIRRTARRGSDLARQLLLFSRRDRGSSPEVVDVNAVILEVETMLRRTLDEGIELETTLADDPHPVHIDPSQIERILMNLTINARDAMPQGGTIAVRTTNLEVDEELVATRPGLHAGSYVVLTVADDGTGMPEDVKRHAFEPFFSTKEVGKGTGLGLATVYGIVQGAQGHIEIDSAPGEGTTFTVYLPRTHLAPGPEAVPEAGGDAAGGSERILLVEDEDAVRQAARRLLERRGYRVEAAPNGETAVGVAAGGSFDLLLTDVLMPGGIDGREVVRQVRRALPRVAILYMTGHSDDVLEDVGIDDDEGEALILRKPFTEEELLRAVRAALARVPQPAR